MWIDFNDRLIKTEDILYVSKGVTSSCMGDRILTLTINTTHTEIVIKYSNDREGTLKRRKDYEHLFSILKEE